MTGPHDHALRERLEHTAGALTWHELASLGSERSARTAVASGIATRLLPNTYVATMHAESFAARVSAALRWLGPGSALSGTGALFAWRLIDIPPPTLVFITTRDLRRACPPWLHLVRVSYDAPVAWWRDSPIVMPAFALAHSYGRAPGHERSELLYRAVRRRGVSVRELREALDVMPRVRARRALERSLEAVQRGAESHLEEVSMFSVFPHHEFAHMVRQHVVRCRDRLHRLDFYDPHTKTAVEFDGAAFHGDLTRRESDLRRDTDLATLGIQTLRLSYRDVTERPEWCRQALRAVLAQRARS